MTTGRGTGETSGERALASLLTALGALLEELRDAQRATDRPAAAASATTPDGAVGDASAPLRTTPPRLRPAGEHPMTQPPFGIEEQTDDEVGLLLSDARERAQAIIDESINRAQDLLRAQPSSQALERIRRTVADMSVDVRAVHSRLDEIEALIRGGAVAYRVPAVEQRPAPQPTYAPPTYVAPSAPAYAPPPTYQAPPAPAYAPPPTYQAPPVPITYEAPPAPAYAPPPLAYAPPPPVYAAPPPENTAPPAYLTPPQPQYRAPEPAPVAPPQPAPAPAEVAPPPPPVAPPPPVEAPAPTAPAPASHGFDPAAGSVALRVSPVAGFQGLMRVQDALARCRGVREAGVEAYAQGEARLRLHFSEHLDGAQLAASLAEVLGRGVRVAAESASDRTVQLALE